MHPSVDFLTKMYPEGPWLLTALPVAANHADKKSPPTQTFFPGQEANVVSWLKSMEGGEFNFYFSVNPPISAMTKKARRTDIKEMAYLHVDIDPKKGEDIDAARRRIENQLTNELPEGVPMPTCVTDSGGGYWGFWRLSVPFKISGDTSRYEEAKLYNLHLETVFGADSCHNVDRIARLPGTVNYPDQKKRDKGRKEAPGRVLFYAEDHVYPLTQFTKAPQVAAKRDGFSQGRTVTISENIERLTMDDLPKSVPDLFVRTISMGFDEVEEDKFDSRSEALWYGVCELVRQGCTDDQIYAIITDPDWGISESVIDGSNGRPEDYAKRQIERAREYAVDPTLAEFNNKFAVVQNAGGGRCRVVYEETFEDEIRIIEQTATDFKNFYSNQFVTITQQTQAGPVPRQVPAGDWWYRHPMRRSYRTIVFEPGKEVADDIYNLWRGFAYDAVPGGSCDLFLEHMRAVICDGNEEVYEYLLGWMALAVQQPDQPGHTAIVLRGGQGAGKGTFARTFAKLFGRHGKQITDAKHLTGHFNAHLRDCVVLFADEAVAAADAQQESMLKTIVTEETLMYTAKGKESTVEKNYLHVIMASNSDWVVPVGVGDRRFVVLDVGEQMTADEGYWRALNRELRNGGYEALLYLLATRDLSDYNPRNKPKTAALQEQKTLSFDPTAAWWYSVLQDGVVDGVVLTDGVIVPTGHVTWSYNSGVDIRRRLSNFRMTKFLEGATAGGVTRKQMPLDRAEGQPANEATGRVPEPAPARPQCFILPPLREMREAFDQTYDGPYQWAPEPQPESPLPDAF